MITPTIHHFERERIKRDSIQNSISVGDIHVEGDVQGNIIVGNHNVIGDNNVICEVNNSHGAIVNIHAPPTIKRRDTPPPPPRLPRGFVGRERELGFLERQISGRGAVLVYAHDGLGKTFLIKKAANSAAALAMPEGIVSAEGVDEGRTLGLQDIFQRLFDGLYESSPPVKVTTSVAQGYLSNTRSLVLLDHLELAPDVLNKLPDMLPKAALVATSQTELFEDIFEGLPLTSLDHDKAIELFAGKSGISADEDTKPVIDRVCSILDDVPLAITIIANAIRQKRLRFEAVADKLATIQPPAQSNIQAAIDRSFGLVYSVLGREERDMLAFTAAAPGNSVDRLWLEGLSGGERTSQALESLELLYTNSPRLRLPDGIRQTLQSGLRDLPDRRAQLLNYLLGELASRGLDFEFVSDELGNILGLVRWAAGRQRWSDVVALGKAVDPFLMLHGLWDAWESVLKHVMKAGQSLQDLAIRGWALHQLGTREIGVGGHQQAINLLLRALEIRASLGDRAGAAYTLHNLNLILPPSESNGPEEPEKPINPSGEPASARLRALLLLAGILLASLISFLMFRPSLAIREEAGPTRFGSIGEVIESAYAIGNPSFRRLPGPISVRDGKSDIYCEPLEAIGNGDEFLDWNETMRCNGQYTITESDVANGAVIRSPQVVAELINVTSPERIITDNFDPRYPSLGIRPNRDRYMQEGEEVKYAYMIENAGSEPVGGPVTIKDDRMEVSCPELTTTGNYDTSLDPGEILLCNATYTITEEDIAYGTVTNTAIASAGEIETRPVTVTIYYLKSVSSLVLEKSVNRETYQDTGEVVQYRYVVTNKGKNPLSEPVVVLDNKVEVICTEVQKVGNQDDRFDPDESIACNATYTITDKDIKQGSVTNIAQASTGDIYSERQATTIYLKSAPPSLALVKLANREFYNTVDERVRYTYIVSNEGHVPLPGPVVVFDELLEVECPDLTGVGNQDEVLDPGEELTCTGLYTISEEDALSESVTNNAWAKAADIVSEPQSVTIYRRPDSNILPILSLRKFADRETFSEAGEVFLYNYFVTNPGSGSIYGPVIVEDDKVREITCPDLETTGDQDRLLDPDETVMCAGRYVISEADIKVGSVTNTARASAGEVGSNPSTVTILEKALHLDISTDPEAYKEVEEKVTYFYKITGRSKAPLGKPVLVVDDNMQVTCPEFNTVGNKDSFLDWDEMIICNATYVISQADIDISGPDSERGFVTHRAVAYSGDVKSNEDEHTIFGPYHAPALSLTHTADPQQYDSVGQVITYTYVITNVGNVTLLPELKIRDDNNAAPDLDCISEIRAFAPKEIVTCTDTYTISQADLNYGNSFVTKSKSAVGSYHKETIISPPASATVSCLYPREGWQSFIVGPGETMDQVITWYSGTTISEIQKANCMGAVSEIIPGQILYVPGPPPTASVSGTVRDSAGKPLAGITVTLMNGSGTAVQLPQVTGRDGWYSFTNLEPGAYRIFQHWFTLYRGTSDTQDFVVLPTTR